MKRSKKLNRLHLHNVVAYWVLWIVFTVLTIASANASEGNAQLVYKGLDLPWSIEFLDADKTLVSEREGRIKILKLSDGSTQLLQKMWPVWFGGQGGLLDLALHPKFETTGWIYASYSKDQGGDASTALTRFKIKDGAVSDRQELFVSNASNDGGRHFGSRIVFDDEGYLYLTLGDRGERDWAQDLKNHAGTVVRLHDDGTIPADNPFVGRTDARPEIWSYGHRNPQGIDFDRATGRLWLVEHGPRGGDEINLVKRGLNYGWPVISYGKEYWAPLSVGEGTEKEGMEQPIKYFTPSIAPSSLLVMDESLYLGALKLQHLNHVQLNAQGAFQSEERLFEDLEERVRDVKHGLDDKLYFITDQGNLYRYQPI